MRHIQRLPYYVCSMCRDIRDYDFIRKTLTSFLGYIVIGWIMIFAMLVAPSSSGAYVSPYIPATLITIALLIAWIVIYYSHYYPMIRRVHRELEMQKKYRFLYDRFNKVE